MTKYGCRWQDILNKVIPLLRNRNISLHALEMRSLSLNAFVTLGREKV
jgi:hypothetical protein